MNPQSPKSLYDSSTSPDGQYSFLELVAEMRALEMDPRPLLATAALDIWQQHGEKVIAYTEFMLDKTLAENDADGIYLWRELYNILTTEISPDYITIH